jgi:hypothetical protein
VTIEQQLAERFHAVVGDEPPLAVDPDELVDRLFRRRRRRQAVGTALGVVAVAMAAATGVTVLGERSTEPAAGYGVAARPTATTPPSTAMPLVEETVQVTTRPVPRGKFQRFEVQGSVAYDRYLYGLTVETKETAHGVLEVRVADVAVFVVELGATGEQYYDLGVAVAAGQVVTVGFHCGKAMAADGLCRAGVTFQFGVADR